jgi:hypothetical protein
MMIVARPFSLLYLALALCCGPDFGSLGHTAADAGRTPRITPDYSGIVLPPNIAPLNFVVREPGTRFAAVISSKKGAPIRCASACPAIAIPMKKWKRLLAQNAGGSLSFTLYTKDSTGCWTRFDTIKNVIATDPIDPYITYRSLGVLYNYSSDLRIHERCLETFREKTLLSTKNFYWGCVNCHTPECNDPRRTVVHTRTSDFGSATILATGGSFKKIDTKLGYTAWRPGGSHIAFSLSKVRQCFHSTGKNPIDDYDLSSEIFIYDVQKETILDIPTLYRDGLIQSWPAWSPDGRFLYFCGGPVLWTDFNKVPPENFDKQKCSLLRAAWNDDGNTIGAVDTVLSSDSTGRSISQPRVSPDGRFVLFCMHAFGPYPVTQPSSDLYLMEISNRRYRRLDCSSNESESWHGWSKNGRWIVFSSKRNGGIITRLYFAHVDSQGVAAKPFILPQKDGAFYDSYLRCFNVPELAVAAVPFTRQSLLKAVRSPRPVRAALPKKRVDAETAANPSAEWSTLKKTAR